MIMEAPSYPEAVATPRTDSLFFRRLEPPAGWDSGREAVAASQRARMLDAVVRAVAERGYARVTVADVVGKAGVSRRTFYEHFEDKQDCFLAAYRTGVEDVIAQILAATAEQPDGDWRAKLRVGLEVYTRALASEPEFARTLLVDVLGAGREAVELRQQLYELFVTRFHNLSEQAVEQDPVIQPVPDVFLRALVGGIGELVQQHVIQHGAEGLEELTPTLVQVAETVIEFGGMRA
jgi:AcrR family transcriptional regulator